MKDSEAIKCRDAGVKWVAFTVANDGLSVVVNKQNTWANCLTVAELKKVWEPGSKVNNWNQIRDSFPNVPLKLFGAGTDSGTFDYFTEAINGRRSASRSDYLATEDDNIVVQGVEGERGAMGYFGYSYYEENKAKLKVLAIDQGKGLGCVTPSIATVQANKYRPLSRPLFIYAKRTSFKRPVVAGFIGYIFNNEKAIAKKSGFIALTDRQLKKARYTYLQALKAKISRSDLTRIDARRDAGGRRYVQGSADGAQRSAFAAGSGAAMRSTDPDEALTRRPRGG